MVSPIARRRSQRARTSTCGPRLQEHKSEAIAIQSERGSRAVHEIIRPGCASCSVGYTDVNQFTLVKRHENEPRLCQPVVSMMTAKHRIRN